MKTFDLNTPELKFINDITRNVPGGMLGEISFENIMDRFDDTVMFLYGVYNQKSIIVINKVALMVTNDGYLRIVSGVNIPNSVLYKTPIQVEITRIYDKNYGPLCMYDKKTLEPLLFSADDDIMGSNGFFQNYDYPSFNKVSEVW